MPFIGFSQDCQELFISEIIFGQFGSNSTGESNFLNHSVEIYNPTDESFILDDYQIALISSSGTENVTVQLEGETEPGDVYVVSHNTAVEDVTAQSDLLSNALNFEGKVEIRLLKNGVVIDKLGNAGQNIGNEPIDFDLLLNDPEYLNSLEINLGSLENLSIRKQATVEAGNPNFQNSDFLSQWSVYPGFVFENLGQHQGSCSEPVIFWKKIDGSDIDKFTYEDILDETRGEDKKVFPNKPPEEFGAGTVVLSSPLSEDLDFNIFAHSHESINPLDPQATFADWSSIDIAQDFVMKAGIVEFKFPELSWALVDMEDDRAEGYGFSVRAVYNGKLIHDPDRDVIDFQIFDPTSSTKDLQSLRKEFKVFPTIAENFIIIENNSQNVTVESIYLIDLTGRTNYKLDFDKYSQKEIKLDLSKVTIKGYQILLLRTNEGLVSKKFYKK